MRLTVLLCVCLAFGSNVLRAGQIFENFDQTDPDNQYVTSPSLSPSLGIGVPFTIPTAPDGFSYALSDFTFAGVDAVAGTPISAILYTADTSSGDPLPGTAVESFSVDLTAPLTTVTSVLNPLLASGAEYLIVLSDPTYDPGYSQGNGLRWYTEGNASTGLGDAFYNSDTGWGFSEGYVEGALQVDATLVSTAPEPGTLLALGSGLALLIGRRFRKK
jgi:hypothetical protein